MEMKASTEHLASISSPRRGSSGIKLLTVAAASALVLSVIAIIVAFVSVGKTSSTNGDGSLQARGDSSGSDDDKIWLLAFETLGFNFGYIDADTGELRGFSIDVANAVCKIANKNCQTVYDSPQRCWDSQAGTRSQAGEGIMAGYYDACVGWGHTYDRPRTLRFSLPYSRRPSNAKFLTQKGNPDSFDWLNLTGKTIGFSDGSLYDEHCVARVSRIQGRELPAEQIKHYPSFDALFQALTDGEIDAVFGGASDSAELSAVSPGLSDCAKGGLSVMTRKDNSLIDWWNPAFEKLQSTPQWPDICADLTGAHGHVGGPDAAQCTIDS